MGFQSTDSGVAASVFLALYTIFLVFMTFIVIKKRFKTVYMLIFLFSLFRFAAQLCGVVYSKLGPVYWQWLIAYLVLGAEGYFALIYAGFRFTCKAQIEKFGESWILKTGPNVGNFRFFFMLKFICRSWGTLFHSILIPANALVIAGGSMLSAMTSEEMAEEQDKINTSKALRTAGQVLFLVLTICLILVNLYVFTKEKVRNHTTIAVMCTAPFLLVRGIFGILSIYLTDMNYFQFSNYENGEVNHSLVIYEYVLGTTMEFISACLLMSKYWLDKSHPNQEIDHELSGVNSSREELSEIMAEKLDN